MLTSRTIIFLLFKFGVIATGHNRKNILVIFSHKTLLYGLIHSEKRKFCEFGPVVVFFVMSFHWDVMREAAKSLSHFET